MKNKSQCNKRDHFITLILIHTQGSITLIYYTRIKGKEIQSEIDLIQTKNGNKILTKILSTPCLHACSSHLSNLQNKQIDKKIFFVKIKM